MLKRADILTLFDALNAELARTDARGELYLVGGAVMALVFNARAATKDLDGYFKPSKVIRDAAARVALDRQLDPGWLNDAVKGFLSDAGSFARYLELSQLTVFTAQPDYLLAMKCLSLRLGPEFHDESDVRYLLRYLNIERYADAVAIISRYYPLDRIPQKTLYALEELLTAP